MIFQRFAATFRRDMLMQWRNGFYAALAFVLLCWFALLSQVATGLVVPLLPALLFGNLMLTGFYFVAGLLLLERDEGVPTALAVTPLRPVEALAAKVCTLSWLGTLESMALAFFAGGQVVNWPVLAVGCLLTGALYVLFGILAISRYSSINAFLMPSILWGGLLSLPALASLASQNSPLLWLHPLWPAYLWLHAAVFPTSGWELGLAGMVAAGWLAGMGWRLQWMRYE
jgi:fluoroquinolone transport system permease protein